MMFDVNQERLVRAIAAELKRQNVVVPPSWAAFVKTGHHRDRPPMDDEWWYTRAASILRTVALNGPIGTEKLRTRYGGRKNRGVAPDRFYPAGGNHIRKILQQLELAKLIKQEAKGVHKGRVITPLGRKLLNAVAGVVAAERKAKSPKEKQATPEKSKEEQQGSPEKEGAPAEKPTEKPEEKQAE